MPITDSRPSSELTEAELDARILQRVLDIHNLADEVVKRLDRVQENLEGYTLTLIEMLD